jgi:predicted regulator of amino acid metabolism with ACT domain
MEIGYTKRLVDRIKEQDTSLPWVQLGLICADREIPVSHVAEFFGVTRQTVYHWFLNETRLQQRYLTKIKEAIEKLRKKSYK